MSRIIRKYDKEFKINAIKLCLEQGKKLEEVARNLGIPKATLYTWIQEFRSNKEEGFRGSGNVKPCNEEVVRLKKQLTDVTQERDILKKAVAIFSRPKP